MSTSAPLEAKRLIKEALGRGSADNITCLIVDLQHPKSKELPPGGVPPLCRCCFHMLGSLWGCAVEGGPTPQKLE
jgi:serine/threonine protein phosphatase PrpC